MFVMNTDGTNEIRVTPEGVSVGASSPSWSPDSSRLAIAVYGDEETNIWVVNADGSGGVPLTAGRGRSEFPSWSPDGRKIAFIRERANRPTAIYVMNADGTGEIQVTPDDEGVERYAPSWSPDGTRLAYSTNRTVWVVSADGSNAKALTQVFARNTLVPDWSPDGSRIAVTQYYDVGLQVYNGIFILRADQTEQPHFFRTSTSNPAWRPAPRTSPPIPITGSLSQTGASGTYFPSDPRAPAGVYRITFGFQNTSTQTFTDLQAKITELTGGHSVVNRDGAPSSSPAGVGSIISVAATVLGSDGNLAPNESFSLVIDVGLQRRESFRIAFTGTGAPVNPAAADAAATGANRSRRAPADILSAAGEFSPEMAATTPTPGVTATPTATLPATTMPPVTATPGPGAPAACAPRPKIDVKTAQVGTGQIEATISTETTAAVPDNALQAVRLAGLVNAQVQVVGGAPLGDQQAYTPPTGSREVKLLVTREQPGPMTANLEIQDGCGTHRTFVGAGAGVR
ncbi:MAG: TolB family protein [Chloroflexota bacterium]